MTVRKRFYRECDCPKWAFVYPKPLCACHKSPAPAEAPAPDGSPWIGWNGGACPVHGRSEVEVLLLSIATSKAGYQRKKASEFNWDHNYLHDWHVVAYRVVKEYREPREFWLFAGKYYDRQSDAVERAFNEGFSPDDVVHVREVMEGGNE